MQVDKDFWQGKKVFITGGAGFVGTHLCNKLESVGAEVLVYEHITPTPHKSIRGDLVVAGKELEDILQEYKPEVIFHLAAQPIVNYAEELLEETLDVNIVGTYKLYLILKNIKSIKSIVHVSTDKVYGDLAEIYIESYLNGVNHPYNVTKLAGDSIARMFAYMFDMPICVIRNGNVYGGGDNHFERLIPRTITEVLKGNSPMARGDGSMSRDYIHMSDVVIGYMNASQYTYYNGNKVFVFGSERSHTILEVINLIKSSCESDVEIVYELPLKGEIPHQHIIDTESEEILGWKPSIQLEDGILLSIPYYRSLLDK
jgi:nucleoside-diphosphate-sugar epimerase